MTGQWQDGLTRRGILRMGAAAAAAAGVGSGPLAMAAKEATGDKKKRIPIAVQLYSVRKDCGKDFTGTIEAIGKMGYEGVEFAGYYGKKAKELRKVLDDNGLKCAGTHTQINTLLGDELKKTIEFHKVLGNQFLICPGLPGKYRNSAQAWLDTAKTFNEIAEKLKPHGMRTGYHNHSIEFKPMDGKVPWDLFFGNTAKEVVMQLDTGNAMHGGGDPVAILKKYPGRAGTVHIKEKSKDGKAMVGEGDVKWKEVLPLLQTAGGTEWYIIEHERYSVPPIECIKRCLVNFKKMLGEK